MWEKDNENNKRTFSQSMIEDKYDEKEIDNEEKDESARYDNNKGKEIELEDDKENKKGIHNRSMKKNQHDIGNIGIHKEVHDIIKNWKCGNEQFLNTDECSYEKTDEDDTMNGYDSVGEKKKGENSKI